MLPMAILARPILVECPLSRLPIVLFRVAARPWKRYSFKFAIPLGYALR